MLWEDLSGKPRKLSDLTYMAPMPELPIPDDQVAPFQIEGEPVRGRLARLGPAVDEILRAHAYPDPVANLLGEACALAALVGSNLKFDGRLIIEARGDGPVRFVVADYDTSGALRGYCGFDPDAVAEAGKGFARPGARSLLGAGHFMMTVDQGPDMDRYQGITAIEGETLALCAEQYFAQSEQTPTRVRLAVGQADVGKGLTWRAGGVLIQNIAVVRAAVVPAVPRGWRAHVRRSAATRLLSVFADPDRNGVALIRTRRAGRHGRGRRQDPGDVRVLLEDLRRRARGA